MVSTNGGFRWEFGRICLGEPVAHGQTVSSKAHAPAFVTTL